MADSYKQALSDRLAYELAAAEEYQKSGDHLAAKHHETLASVYRSLLDRQP